jgi:hypothetical protein
VSSAPSAAYEACRPALLWVCFTGIRVFGLSITAIAEAMNTVE